MTDPQQSSQFLSNSMDYWNNPSNWAKPVSGNALQTDTQSLNNMGSTNLQSSAGSGFAAGSQGVTGGGFGATPPSGSIPNTNADNVNGENTNNTTQASTGNVQSTFNQAAQQQTNLSNLQNQVSGSKGGSSSPQQASSGSDSGLSGLSNNLFSSAVQKLTGDTPGQLGSSLKSYATTSVDNLGSNLGFAQGASNPLGLSAGSGFSSSDLAAIQSDFGAGTSQSALAAANSTDALGGSLSLSSALGAAGLGYAGGTLLSQFDGEKAQGSGIGGAAGAVAGAEIGSIVPGIGTIIGGIVGGIGGSLLGGLFGAGQGTSVGLFSGSIAPNGNIGGGAGAKYSSKNGSIALPQQEESQLNGLFNAASSQLGIKFNTNVNLVGGYNTLHSPVDGSTNYLTVNTPTGNNNYGFDPSNNASVSSAYFNVLSQAASASGYTDTTSLYNWFYGQPSQVGASAANSGSNPLATNQAISIAPKVT